MSPARGANGGGGTRDEGQAQRQEDLRQVQGDPPARSRPGDLREPASQAAPGLTPCCSAGSSTTSKQAHHHLGPSGPVTPRSEAGARRCGKAVRKTSDAVQEPPGTWHVLSESTSPARSGSRSHSPTSTESGARVRRRLSPPPASARTSA